MNYLFVKQNDPLMLVTGLLPVGLAYVAGALKAHGRSVYGLNLTYNKERDALKKTIEENSVNVVCIGALSPEYSITKRLVSEIKSINSDIYVIIGGGLVSASPELVAENIGADFCVYGPGEDTICELSDALEKDGDFSAVDGLLYFDKNGKLVKNKPRQPVENIDDLPFPLFEIFEIEKTVNTFHRIDIAASRSCPFNCTFCWHPSGTKYIQRSLDSIFSEVEHWLRNYSGIKFFGFSDELFAQDEARFEEFCERIKKYNINYRINMRVCDVTEKVMHLLKNSGCDEVSLGLESADDRILTSMRKHTTVKQIEDALRIAKQVRVSVMGLFIFGDPEETLETMNNTFDFWLKHIEYNISLSPIYAYPSTPIYKYAVEKGIIKNELEFIEQGCPAVNLSKLTDKEYAFMLRRVEKSRLLADFFVSDITAEGFDENGFVFGKAECTLCGAVLEYPAMSRTFGTKITCPSCGAYLMLTMHTLLEKEFSSHTVFYADAIFNGYKKANKSVAVYGVVARIRTALALSNSLRSCVNKVFDDDYEHRDKLLGIYEIENPELLKTAENDYDCIVIPDDERIVARIKLLRRRYCFNKEIIII